MSAKIFIIWAGGITPVDVEYSVEFTYRGERWVIHRPLYSRKTWRVAHKETGFGMSQSDATTRAEAKNNALKYIKRLPPGRFEKGIKNAKRIVAKARKGQRLVHGVGA